MPNFIEKHRSTLSKVVPIFLVAVCCVLAFSPLIFAEQYQPAQHIKITAKENNRLLSAADVMSFKQQNPLCILVDVRKKTEFQKIRIPESINIPLPFVKTKSYLHGMKVILLDNGHDLKRLLQEADALGEKGLDISVLAGGLAAWHQHGGKFAGDLFSVAEFHLLPANHLLPGIRSPFIHTYIDISSEQSPASKIDFPNLFHVPVQSKNDLPQLASFIKKQKIEQLSAVLILNNDGKYEAIASLPELCNTTVFFLKGGGSGYFQATQQHVAMIQTREKRLKTIGGCPTCPAAKEKKLSSEIE